MIVVGAQKDRLETISIQIPHSLVREFEGLMRQNIKGKTHDNLQSFWQMWLPMLRDLVKSWELNESIVNQVVDKVRLGVDTNGSD